MSLRTSLALLPDDRGTDATVREVIAFFRAHPHEQVDALRVSRATGMPSERVDPVLQALAKGRVIDCDGDPMVRPCSFDPDTMLAIEIKRFLRTRDSASSKMQVGVDKFRGRQGLI